MKTTRTMARLLRDSLGIAILFTALFEIIGDTRSPILVTFARTLLFTVPIVVLAVPVLEWLWPRIRDANPTGQWTIFVAVLIAACVAACAAGAGVLKALRVEEAPYSAIFFSSLKISVFGALLIGIGEAMFEIQRDKLQSAQARADKLAAEARLAALESRLHPHFLFNTLNSISSLIPSDPQRAERLIERMAALLRFALDVPSGGLVQVQDELKIVQDYLEIEQARLGHRLRYSLDIAPGLNGARVPPLSIQTLVENSIKHAIAPDRQGGEVHVTAGAGGGALRIDVADSGPPFTADEFPPGHGLDNLRGRLSVLFGGEASLELRRTDGRTVASMRVPAP